MANILGIIIFVFFAFGVVAYATSGWWDK